MAATFVDTVQTLANVLDGLGDLTSPTPALFFDLEGNNLCRHGTVSILQMLVKPQQHVYLIDILTLGSQAFTTSGSESSLTLKAILESSAIPKVFFDVRNDSDALYGHFGIHLTNVEDLQLMELATRYGHRRYINGLARCIERDGGMSLSAKTKWSLAKRQGHSLFDPQVGGSYAVFDQRPLSDVVRDYCVQDVLLLPNLWDVYAAKMTSVLWKAVREASQLRIQESHLSTYNGKGPHRTLAPWPNWPNTK